jgi:hypothetical protein
MMTRTQRLWNAWLLDSPVTQAELRLQQRERPRSIWGWIGFVLIVAMFALAVTLLGYHLWIYSFFDTSRFNTEIPSILTVVLSAVTTLWHFRILFQTVVLSTNSISREKQSGNWDLLILTGLDAQTLIRSKWSATVRQQWQRSLRLGILRGLAVCVVGIPIMTSSWGFREQEPGLWYPLLLCLLTILFMVGMSLLNLLMTAAFGVYTGVRYGRPLAALGYAFGWRVFALAGSGGLFLLLFYGLVSSSIFQFSNPVSQIIGYPLALGLTLWDNGSLAGLGLMGLSWWQYFDMRGGDLDQIARDFWLIAGLVAGVLTAIGLCLWWTQRLLRLASRRLTQYG